MKHVRATFFRLVLWMLLFGSDVPAQVVRVHGNVHTSQAPVKWASVTFTNINDRALQYTTTTDDKGDYQLTIVTTGIESRPISTFPQSIELEQNYPNPFSLSTTISYELHRPTAVSVTIYDILGREVMNYASSGIQSLGSYGVSWNGKNSLGAPVAPGVYFYRVQSDRETLMKKMVYMGGHSAVGSSFSLPRASMISHSWEHLEKSARSGMMNDLYTVSIKNTDHSEPKIQTREYYQVTLQEQFVTDFIVKEATSYKMNLFVGNWGNDNIYVIDTDSDQIVDSLSGFRMVNNVIPVNNGKKLYVTTLKTSKSRYDSTYPAAVYSVDLTTKVKTNILTKTALLRITPDGTPLIIACLSEEGFRPSTDTMRVIGTIDTLTDKITFFDTLDINTQLPSDRGDQVVAFDPVKPYFYAWTPSRHLFAYNYQLKKIAYVDTSVYFPYHISMSSEGKYVYCACGPIIDVVGDSVAGWMIGRYNYDTRGSIAVTPNESYAYVTDRPVRASKDDYLPSGKIEIFGLTSGRNPKLLGFIDLVKTTNSDANSDMIILMPDGKKGYVSDGYSKIYVLDTEVNDVVNVIRFVPKNILIGPLSLGAKN